MKFLPKTINHAVRIAILCFIVIVTVVFGIWLPMRGITSYEPQEGDIVFQSLPVNELVAMIEGATHSPFSHCGVVNKKDGRWMVLEALGNVHYTPLLDWLMRGRGKQFAVYRLKPTYQETIPDFIDKMETYLDSPYDFRYRMDEEAMYCSELIYKGYKQATGEELGQLTTLGELDYEPFAPLIRQLEGEQEIPTDRKIIPPSHLAKAAQLELVHKNGYENISFLK